MHIVGRSDVRITTVDIALVFDDHPISLIQHQCPGYRGDDQFRNIAVKRFDLRCFQRAVGVEVVVAARIGQDRIVTDRFHRFGPVDEEIGPGIGPRRFAERVALLQVRIIDVVGLFGVDMAAETGVMCFSRRIFRFRVALRRHVRPVAVDDGQRRDVGNVLIGDIRAAAQRAPSPAAKRGAAQQTVLRPALSRP